ncbi:MAG: enoyl-CoA hydratase-related protein [Dehalococcoidales bacterium]|nr:enoyl-CoA hydratase-related protein [Dehalococcoidales bacterium]
MKRDFVLYEKKDAIAKITVNRPDVLNAISRQVYAELDDAFTEAEKDKEVKVIIVAGAGRSFGSGHDMGSKQAKLEEERNPRDRTPLGILKEMETGTYSYPRDHWRNIPKPTIAMVQGWCIMANWMLAASCDLIIAADDAKFQEKTTRSWGGGSIEYPAYYIELGPRKAKELVWLGEPIGAQDALRLGIVNRVVPREHLEEETIKIAKKITMIDTWGLMASKMAINQAADIMGQAAAIKATCNWWSMTKMTRDAKEFAKQYNVTWVKGRDAQFKD